MGASTASAIIWKGSFSSLPPAALPPHLSICSLSASSTCASTPSDLKLAQASSSRHVPLTSLQIDMRMDG